ARRVDHPLAIVARVDLLVGNSRDEKSIVFDRPVHRRRIDGANGRTDAGCTATEHAAEAGTAILDDLAAEALIRTGGGGTGRERRDRSQTGKCKKSTTRQWIGRTHNLQHHSLLNRKGDCGTAHLPTHSAN